MFRINHISLMLFSLIITTSKFSFAEEMHVPYEFTLDKYGFNWLKPETAECVQITKQLAEKFKDCYVSEESTFTQQKGHIACNICGGTFLIYDTKIRCIDELETMRANAP